MYPVNSRFHNLIIQDSPTTRVRIYFISDSVDCTNDADVQTHGTLLVGAAGDTDSNARIGKNGITWLEYFNSSKNTEIGRACSYQIGMTLMNQDGALNNFAYGRCKVYLDVWDAANSTWRTCPMGVFVIEQPLKQKKQLVDAIGFDQMQKLSAICDTWWNSLNWSSGITLLQLINSMATNLGVKVSSNTASNIVNGSVTFTEAPFDCDEVTYREVLEYIAEATGTNARFDRNGALDLRWFATAQIGGSTITINADTIGNQVFSVDVAQYQVPRIDLLKVKIAEDDIGTTVGSGTSQYTIIDNLFLTGDTVAEITTKATPIYNRLRSIDWFKPVQLRYIIDPSVEAGDIFYLVYESTTYAVPIFQHSMTWRGGYVVADMISDGDKVRPVANYDERATYRMTSEISKKVGDNEIISKINQTAESIQIQASKVDLTGYVTLTNLATSGQTVINGGNITTGSVSADRISGGTLTLGGQNNVNGQLNILDASGNVVGVMNNNGASISGNLKVDYNGVVMNVGTMPIVDYDLAGDPTFNYPGLVTDFGEWGKVGFLKRDVPGSSYRDILIAANPGWTTKILSGGESSDYLRRWQTILTLGYGDLQIKYAMSSRSTPSGPYSGSLETFGFGYSSAGNISAENMKNGVGSCFGIEYGIPYPYWYRCFEYNASSLPLGSKIRFLFKKTGPGSSVGDIHEVTLLVANGYVFTNEISSSSPAASSSNLFINKLRITTDGSKVFADFQCAGVSGSATVYARVDAYGTVDTTKVTVPEFYRSTASGETVLANYTFADNTVTDFSSQVSMPSNAAGFVKAQFDSFNRKVTVDYGVRITSGVVSQSNPFITIPSAFIPKANADGACMIHVQNDDWYPHYARADTSGGVTQKLTGTADRVYGRIEYYI